MLAKKYRLNIQEFFAKKPTFSRKGPFFVLKAAPSGLSYSRYGVVVGKKVSKRATERNRIRRIFYRSLQEKGSFRHPGFDVMIQVFPNINEFDRIAQKGMIDKADLSF